MSMMDCNPKYTLVDKIPVGKDLDGDPCTEDWQHSLVVGVMLYLAGNTRPDIAFFVHQCARFSHNPRSSREVALERIARYLRGGGKDKVIILSPNRKKLQLDLFADADFAGLFVSDDNQYRVSVKSWTGLLMNFGGGANLLDL